MDHSTKAYISKIIGIIAFIYSIGNAQWTRTGGPEAATAQGMTVVNEVIYAATQDYVYKSIDFGDTWIQLKNGILYNEITSITGKNEHLFAGTTGSGIYYSPNKGISWAPLRGILPINYISSFCWSDSILYVGSHNGVYRSTDIGKTWSSENNGLSENMIESLFSYDSIVFAGTYQKGVFRSTNLGESWSLYNKGVENRHVYSIIMIDSAMYAGTDSGLFRRTASDSMWVVADSMLAHYSVRTVSKVFGTLFVGTNKGIWTSVVPYVHWTQNRKGNTIMSFAPLNGKMFAGSLGRGVFRSDDTGRTWI